MGLAPLTPVYVEAERDSGRNQPYSLVALCLPAGAYVQMVLQPAKNGTANQGALYSSTQARMGGWGASYI